MRWILSGVMATVLSAVAMAHFVYIVPAATGSSVQVIFSDSLEADENVPIEKIKSLKLMARNADGSETAVPVTPGAHALTATVPPTAKVLFGDVTYGLFSRENIKPALLVYHPKAVLAGCDTKTATVGTKAIIEIVPVVQDGKTAFIVYSAGQPVTEAEVNLMLPNGEKTKLKTNAQGQTDTVTTAGRYAAWVKHTESKTGEHDGKKYEEIRHYATLIVDVK